MVLQFDSIRLGRSIPARSCLCFCLPALGIDDVLHFDFLSPPPVDLMSKALEVGRIV